MKMKKLSDFLFLVIVLLLSMVLSGCGGSDQKVNNTSGNAKLAENFGEIGVPKEGVAYQETIKTAYSSDLDNPDPYASTSLANRYYSNLVFDDLVHFDLVTNKMVSSLAKSWKDVNGDGKTWDFILEKNVKFHNGDPFTAADVKFTFERGIPGSGKTIKSIIAMNYVKSIAVVDEYTVRFNLNSPVLDFYAYCNVPIVSKKAFDTMAAKEAGVIGTGPYMFFYKNWNPGVQYMVVRNDNYWNGSKKYATKNIVVRYISDENTRVAALQSGELDFIYNVSSSYYSMFADDNNFRTFSRIGAMTYYMGFNLTQEKLNNQELRKAVAMAINRKNIVDVAYEKSLGATEANNLISQYSQGYAEINYIKYDPAGAVAILKKLGYSKEKPLVLKLVYFDTCAKMAEVMQADFTKLEGVAILQLEQKDATNFTPFIRAHNGFDLYINSHNPVGAMTYASSIMFSKGAALNYSGYSSDKFENLLNNVTNAKNLEGMAKEFVVLQQFMSDEAVNLPLVRKNMLAVSRKGLEGLALATTLVDLNFSTVRIPKK